MSTQVIIIFFKRQTNSKSYMKDIKIWTLKVELHAMVNEYYHKLLVLKC